MKIDGGLQWKVCPIGGIRYFLGHDGTLYYFDEERAKAWCDFAERFGSLTDGKSDEDVGELLEWHKMVLSEIFGWRRVQDQRRRYRRVFIFVPRKNAKTWLMSIIAMGMLLGMEGEKGQQIYIACAAEKQAKICYEMCVAQHRGWEQKHIAFCEERDKVPDNLRRFPDRKKTLDKDFAKEFHVASPTKEQKGGVILHWPGGDTPSNGKIVPLPGTLRGQTGLNASCIIFDEYHELSNRELESALITSSINREDPLFIYPTTAGNDVASPCFNEFQYACKIKDGVLINDTYLPLLYYADPKTKDDALQTEEVLRKLNPAWGKTINIIGVREIFSKAKQTGDPTELQRALQFHCNKWIARGHTLIPLPEWDACAQQYVDEDMLVFENFRIPGGKRLLGRTCYGGLDLAKTRDMNALNLTFWEDVPVTVETEYGIKHRMQREYDVIQFFWCPRAALSDRVDRGYGYDLWAEWGLVNIAGDGTIDTDEMADQIGRIADLFRIVDIGYDPYCAQDINRLLTKQGLQMTIVRQHYLGLSPPTKEIDMLVEKRRLRHNNNATMRWNVSNCIGVHDKKGNVMPSKGESGDEHQIDGVAAMVNSFSRILTEPVLDEPPSGVWA